MVSETQLLPATAETHASWRAQITSWLAMILLGLNAIYILVILLVLTFALQRSAAFECTGPTLPTKACYWLTGMPLPGTSGNELFLPVSTPEAAAG